MRPETLAVHAGRKIDASTGAVVPPLHLSTTFERDADGGFSRGYVYSRDGNPTVAAFEECLTALEGGTETIGLPSGMAAGYAILQTLVPGDRVVATRDLYYGFRDLLIDHFPARGIETEFVDANDDDALDAALAKRPKLFWIETPSNPLIQIVDIARAAFAAHHNGALLVCENSFASPAVTRPFEHGADVVVHSVTKYLAGHSDVTAGAVVVRDASELAAGLRHFQRTGGAVLSPFDAWLALRGIATLPLRANAHSANALSVAKFLSAHPKVERVHYPGLPSHPGHSTAVRQMRGFGGMLSFEVHGGRERAFDVAARLKLIVRATSLGGVHSLIEHRASIEGKHTLAPESLLRLSVGIEHPDDLVADLEQALA